MIRLQRIGRKNQPYFRFVVTDSKNSTKSGKFLEVIGFFDFRKNGKHTIQADRVKHWISMGAQVSDTVHNYLVGEKILDGNKKNVLPRKSPIKKEEAKKEEAAPKADASQEAAPAAEEAPKEEVKA